MGLEGISKTKTELDEVAGRREEAHLEDNHSSSAELVSFLIHEFRESRDLPWGSVDGRCEGEGRRGLGVGFGVLIRRRGIAGRRSAQAHQPLPSLFLFVAYLDHEND